MAELEAVAEEPEKKGKGKLIGIVGGVVVLLGAVYFLFPGGGGGEDPVRYARITFAVVLPEGGDSTVVGDKMPLLKDGVLDVVAGLTAADLVGSSGLDELRASLTAKALEIYPDGEVLRVVLTEVLVQ